MSPRKLSTEKARAVFYLRLIGYWLGCVAILFAILKVVASAIVGYLPLVGLGFCALFVLASRTLERSRSAANIRFAVLLSAVAIVYLFIQALLQQNVFGLLAYGWIGWILWPLAY